MKKIFCLDANVLAYDSESIFSFKDNDVIVPLVILEELDNLKKRNDEVGINCRTSIRHLDTLRQEGCLREGVPLPNGGKLFVIDTSSKGKLPVELSGPDKVDNILLSVMKSLTEKNPDNQVSLITKDVNLRVKCNFLKILCEDYNKHRVTRTASGLFTGVSRIFISEEEMKALYDKKFVNISKETVEENLLYPNELLVIKTGPNNSSAIAMFDKRNCRATLLREYKKVWNLSPRNKEQIFAFNLLLNDSIKLVSLVGPAGTGKTLLAIASGLHQVIEEKAYSKLVVSRPVHTVGKDLGYLPGSYEEKMSPWIQPIEDNLKYLLTSSSDKHGNVSIFDMYVDRGIIEVEAIAYMRGRSISDALIIIDEAQNLSVHELKTILTRAGENTKIVLTGDIDQIDNSYVDSVSNGLSYAVEKFKEHEISGHVSMIKGERSELATLASKIL